MAKDITSLIKPGYGLTVVTPSEYDHMAWNGKLLIWEAPKDGETYAIGVDPAEGVARDRSVCEVIKTGNLVHPDEQVAEFACDFLSPTDFADVVNTIGRFYRDPDGTEAFATVECNAPCGNTMILDLTQRCDYTNLYIWKQYDRINNLFTNKYGWWTNKTTRPNLIARGMDALQKGDLLINSSHLLDEMSDFERDHYIAKAKARYGRHDDRILALLMAYYGWHDQEWINGEDVATERRMRGQAGEIQKKILPELTKRADYMNTAITAREMASRADEWLLDGD